MANSGGKQWHSSNHMMYYHPLQGDVRILRHRHHYLLLATSVMKRVVRKSRNDSCFVSFSSFRWLLCFNKDLTRKEHYVLIKTMVNPLSPKSDQHEISPYNVNALETEWSWELRTWSGKMNLIYTSTNCPHCFSWKRIGTTNENLNFDIRVKRV